MRRKLATITRIVMPLEPPERRRYIRVSPAIVRAWTGTMTELLASRIGGGDTH
jgi:hypothetical protein